MIYDYKDPTARKRAKPQPRMTNAEVYGMLSLILSELQKINARLDDLIVGCEAELDYRPIDFSSGEVKVPFDEHLPDLMYREDKNLSL